MKKIIVITLLCTLAVALCFAQNVGISTTTPNARLDIVSDSGLDALAVEHTGATGNILDLNSLNPLNTNGCIAIRNYTTGAGIQLNMNNLTSAAMGMSINQKGIGRGLSVTSSNTATNLPSIFVSNNGSGHGVEVFNSNVNNNGHVLNLNNYGIGMGIRLIHSNANNTDPAIRLGNSSVGSGIFILQTNTSNVSPAIDLVNSSPANGFRLNNSNPTNSNAAAVVTNDGLGSGIMAENTNVTNENPALRGENTGVGSAILGLTRGVASSSIVDENSSIIGTNFFKSTTGVYFWLKGNSGVSGTTRLGNAGTSGYVWKNTVGQIQDVQGGYFATVYGPSTLPLAVPTTYSFSRVAYVDATGTPRKIDGTGPAGTIVKNTKSDPVLMTAVESPEILFTDYGSGQLVKGKATIQLDPDFTKNIVVDQNNKMKVFVQLNEDCNGVYVTNMTATSFDVIELRRGKSNAKFSYEVVANRANVTENGNTIYYDARKRFAPGPSALPVQVGTASGKERE